MPVVKSEVPYTVEVFDTAGRRVARYREVPILDVTRARADRPDRIEGLLPRGVTDLGPGYRVRVALDGVLFCEATVTRIAPRWGDTRKLILDRFVNLHEVIAFEAEREALEGNTRVAAAYTHRTIDRIVKDAINRALGAVHYTVDHGAHPEGAEREFAKFVARQGAEGPLEIGGISTGSWVDAGRIDASGAFAKDGDTIAGLVVDGVPWPDLRLMLIDCEETSLNSHAIDRHPEVADWTAAQYAASGYKLNADAATAALQALIDTHGIGFIELNPHRGPDGAFDDRVDVFGRYLGFVYGGLQCFNAAMVEQGHADVYLYADGAFHVPEMELKDYFSYMGPAVASIEPVEATLASFDTDNRLYETLTALAYAAGGYVWDVDLGLRVSFRAAGVVDRIIFFDSIEHDVEWGAEHDELTNVLFFEGNPLTGPFEKTYTAPESIDHFGPAFGSLDYFSLRLEEDADRLAQGILEDVAYPEPAGAIVFLNGSAAVRVGELVEVRGGPVRRLFPAIDGEWAGRYDGRNVARVTEVVHRFQGRHVTTTARLGSPLRSVGNPLRFITKGQPTAQSLFQFRLDDAGVGLDAGYHLD